MQISNIASDHPKTSLFRQLFRYLAFAGLLLYFCLKFYSENISSFPAYMHAWSQSDRYALALNFQQNQFDFFHPQTYNLSPQFPAQTPPAVEKGITQVDFPIHDYLIAIIMKISGNNSPVVFRLYVLIYGLLGFFFLFLLVLRNTQSVFHAMFIILFAFLSPVLVYYLNGFIPSVTSVSNVFIALFFYFDFLKSRKTRHLAVAVFFAMLAALGRMPFVMFLCTMLLHSLLVSRQWHRYRQLLVYLPAFALFIAYFIYNRYLANAYGSVFLTKLLKIESFGEFLYLIEYVYQNWFFEYLTAAHYGILLVLLIIFILKRIRSQKLSDFQKHLLLLFVISFGAALLYFVVMLKQFHSHDYYFLDSFFIPLILLVIALSMDVKINTLPVKALILLVLHLFGFYAYLQCSNSMAARYRTEGNQAYNEYLAYSGSEKFVKDLGLDENSSVLVVGAFSANIPLILMNRKGYVVMNTDEKSIREGLSKNPDYVIMQNEIILSEVVNYFPGILREIAPIATNGMITIYKKAVYEGSLPDFLLLNRSPMQLILPCCKESSYQPVLNDTTICDSIFYVNHETEYTNLVNTKIDRKNQEDLSVIISLDYRIAKFSANNTDLVVALDQSNKQVYYKAYPLNTYVGNTESDSVSKHFFEFKLPCLNQNNLNLSCYIWNNGKNRIEIRKACIWLYSRTLTAATQF